MTDDALRLEFGRYTEWILEAVEAVGVDDPVPVACRGTADPALFEDLAEGIGARPGLRVLDAGCGMGGPAAWLRRTTGCDVVGVDLMQEAVRAARRLFADAVAVAGSLHALPFRARSFEAAWAVGVLELVEDKAGALRDVARVLEPGGRVALYTFTLAAAELDDPPVSDHFVAPDAISALAESAGLEVRRAAPAPFGGRSAEPWHGVRAAVEAEIRRRHGSDPEFGLVKGELGRFARLRASAAVQPWHFDLVAS